MEKTSDAQQASAYEGGQRPNLISGFPSRRVCPIRCANNMKPRIEKNRKHLATIIAAILGALVLLVVNQFWPLPSQQWTFTIWTFVAVLATRTVFVESGIRRPANGFEKNMDQAGIRIADKHFGVVVMPHDTKNERSGDEAKR
jgi:hypothetical protein